MTKTWFGSRVPHCWLPIKSHISYKLLLLTSKCLHALVPSLMALQRPTRYPSSFLGSKEAFYPQSHPLKLSVDFIIATYVLFLFVIYYCQNIIIKIIYTGAGKKIAVFGINSFLELSSVYLLVCLSLKSPGNMLIMKCCFNYNVAKDQIFKLINEDDRHFSVKGRTDSICNMCVLNNSNTGMCCSFYPSLC